MSENWHQEFVRFNTGISKLPDDIVTPSYNLFKPVHSFMVDAVGLLTDRFDPVAQEFYDIALAARKNEPTREELESHREKLRRYYKPGTGLNSQRELSAEEDAIFALLQILLYGRWLMTFRWWGADVAMAVENFAMTYIEFFGNADQLIELYIANFRSYEEETGKYRAPYT